jgi:hypothetical protein
VNLGTAVPATLETLTLKGSNNDGALQAETTAAGQTFTVTNTNGGTASTLTMANFANTSATTGSGGDGVTVDGGAATTGLSVNTGGGADTVTATLATAWSGLGNSLNGGGNLTGTVDTFSFGYDTAGLTLNLAGMITAGDIAGFEAVTGVDMSGTTEITAGTGFTSYDFALSNDSNETINITSTAAQANAMTNIVYHAGATTDLTLSDAGTVSLAGDTVTNLDTVTIGANATTFTFPNIANQTGNIALTQTGAAGGGQTMTFGTLTNGGGTQAATIADTGTVAFNISAASLALISDLEFDGTAGTNGSGAFTAAAAAAATASLNVTGAGGNFNLVDDADITLTNIDTVNIDTTTASVIGAGVDAGVTMAQTLNLGAFSGHTVKMDSVGDQSSTVTVTGFAAGTAGDIIHLNDNSNNATTDITTHASVATTGYTLPATAAVTAIVTVVSLAGATSQITGALTQVGDAGAVEAAIIAAGLVTPAGNASNIYMTLDNGTDTGLYRVAYDEIAADGANAGVISTAGEITGVVLIGVLSGLADTGDLVAANF